MHIQTRLEPSLYNAFQEAATREGMTLSQYLRKLVEQDLKSKGYNCDSSRVGEVKDGKSPI